MTTEVRDIFALFPKRCATGELVWLRRVRRTRMLAYGIFSGWHLIKETFEVIR